MIQELVQQRGIIAAMLEEALENRESLGLLGWPCRGTEVGLTEDAWRTCHLGVAVTPHPPASVGGGGPRPVALISLFDGLSTARLALQDRLEEYRCGPLAFGGFAELDGDLARAIGVLWASRAALGLTPPYHRLADDVWDLVRLLGGRFTQLCSRLPAGALILIVGGSPCQD
ncbi:MAG: hypothetical protein ACKPKO_21495, partial [Candidatus Fonsibacter sp.]